MVSEAEVTRCREVRNDNRHHIIHHYSVLVYSILFHCRIIYSFILSLTSSPPMHLLNTTSTLPPFSQIVVNVGKRFLEDDADTVYAEPCVFANFMDPGSEQGGGCYLPILDTATLKVIEVLESCATCYSN